MLASLSEYSVLASTLHVRSRSMLWTTHELFCDWNEETSKKAHPSASGMQEGTKCPDTATFDQVQILYSVAFPMGCETWHSMAKTSYVGALTQPKSGHSLAKESFEPNTSTWLVLITPKVKTVVQREASGKYSLLSKGPFTCSPAC